MDSPLETPTETSKSLSPEEIEMLQTVKDTLAGISHLTPEQRKRFIAIVTNPNLPKDWGMNSVAPYYNSRAAYWLKATLDEMLKDPEHNRKFYPKDQGLVYRSLRVKINQAWQWLIDNDDGAKHYVTLRNLTKIDKDRGALLIKWKDRPGIENFSGVKGVAVPKEDLAALKKWKDELDKFIDTAKDGEKLELKGLDLDFEQIEWIKMQFMELPEFHVVRIDEHGFKIVKDSEIARLKREGM
jgi:hypothetical protein